MTNYYLSKEQLATEQENRSEFYANLVDSILQRLQKSFHNNATVFLSHKHDEGTVLLNVISMLKNLGVDVYLDWMDDDMPKYTSGETASKIKQKIKHCNKFILLATEGAITSKWCNWELGYGDAHKYSEHIAIMPITDTRDGKFSGSEYLEIYPIIKTEYQYINTECYVEYGSKKIKLKDWLKQ
ncbi:MAG: toll/interleukin-1 receptor domain-containing protein [Tannerellaceae bacterium]